MPVKVRMLIRMLEKDGWRLTTTRGSHRQYKHPLKPGRVTVPGKLSVATGRTIEECEREMRGAIALHLEGLTEDGAPIPRGSGSGVYVERSAA